MPLEGKEAVLATYRENADRFVRALALETTRRLVDKTPVDTGRAKANWHLAVDAPDATIDDGAKQREARRGKAGKERSDEVVYDVMAAITEAQNLVGELVAGARLFVTNALPYIGPLEDGHSGQAPKGMIGLTVAELKAWLPGAIRSLQRGD